MNEFLTELEYQKARVLTKKDLIEAIQKDPHNISLICLLHSQAKNNNELVESSEKLVEVLSDSTISQRYPSLLIGQECKLAQIYAFNVKNYEKAIVVSEKTIQHISQSKEAIRCYDNLAYLYWSYAVSLKNFNKNEASKEAYKKALEYAEHNFGILSDNKESDMRAKFCFRLAALSTLPEDKFQYWQQSLRYLQESLISYRRYDNTYWFDMACAHSLLGQLKPCLEAAQIALFLGSHVADFKADTDFNNVRNTQEFKELMERKTTGSIKSNHGKNYLQNRLQESKDFHEKNFLELILKRYDHIEKLGEMLINGFPESDSEDQKKESEKLINVLDECDYKNNFFIYDFLNKTMSVPLRHVCWRKNTDFLRILLQRGANPGFDEHSAFFSLVEENSNESQIMLEILIEHGLDVNAKPYRFEWRLGGYVCEPLLVHAIRAKNMRLALTLIKANALLDVKSCEEKTPLELAVDYRLQTVITEILKRKPLESGLTSKIKESLDNPLSCPTLYYGTILKKTAFTTPHYMGDTDIKKYYKDAQISECGHGASHMLTLDLTEFKDFPDSVKKWKTYDLVFSPPCEDCDGWLTDRMILERQKDGTLKRTDIDLSKKSECSPESIEPAKKRFVEFKDVHEGKITRNTIVVGGNPQWMQNPEWPEDQEPIFFVGQLYDQDYGDKFFLFLGTQSGKEIVVHQMT